MLSHSDVATLLRGIADGIERAGSVAPAPAPPPPTQDPTPAPSVSLETPPVAATPPPSADQAAPPAQPAPSAPAAGPKPVIDLTTVKGIQQAFNQIRGANFPKLEENGLHGEVMTWALKEFQASVGIPVTGKIDETTINTLHKAIFGTSRT